MFVIEGLSELQIYRNKKTLELLRRMGKLDKTGYRNLIKE